MIFWSVESQRCHIKARTPHIILSGSHKRKSLWIKLKVTSVWWRSHVDMALVLSQMKLYGSLYKYWQEKSWEYVLLMKCWHQWYPCLCNATRGSNSLGEIIMPRILGWFSQSTRRRKIIPLCMVAIIDRVDSLEDTRGFPVPYDKSRVVWGCQSFLAVGNKGPCPCHWK